MTKEELAALVELLNRWPMTTAERLFWQAFIQRETAKHEAPPTPTE